MLAALFAVLNDDSSPFHLAMLIAFIVGIIATVLAVIQKAYVIALLCASITFAELAFLYLTK
jgi:hypothetical protein